MKQNRINLFLGIFWLAVTVAGVVLYITTDLGVPLPFCILTFVVGAMFLGLYFSLRTTLAQMEKQKQLKRQQQQKTGGK